MSFQNYKTLGWLTLIFLGALEVGNVQAAYISTMLENSRETSTLPVTLDMAIDCSSLLSSLEYNQSSTISIGSAQGGPGKRVTVPITLDASVDCASLLLRLDYDPNILEYPSVTAGEILASGHTLDSFAPEAGRFNFIIYNPIQTTAFNSQTGLAAYLEFQIKGDAPKVITDITLTSTGTPTLPASGLLSSAGGGIAHTVTSGQVITSLFTNAKAWMFYIVPAGPANAAEPGDVNGDGEVDLLDVQLIKEHLLERSLLTGDALTAADANEDGQVDLEDIAFLHSLITIITIDIIPNEGSWTLEGPAGFTTITGTGDRTGDSAIINAPVGDYTLTCDDNITSYTAPAPQTKTLSAGGALAFRANYNLEGAFTIFLPGDVPLEMMLIPSGSFLMGRYPDEQDSSDSEDPQHTVTIGYDFYLGKYELTKRQWQAVMGATPWVGESNVLDDPDSPAVYVSWDDIVSTGGFLETLNTHLANTSQGVVRLPSEAEWEYACRADDTSSTPTRFSWGDDLGYTQIGDYAWYRASAYDVNERYAHIVALKLPNNWGLYDMSGNVWEWCQDYWHDSYSGATRPDDGSAWESPTSLYRVVRGGAWYNGPWFCRSAYHSWRYPGGRFDSVGFRLLRTQN